MGRRTVELFLKAFLLDELTALLAPPLVALSGVRRSPQARGEIRRVLQGPADLR